MKMMKRLGECLWGQMMAANIFYPDRTTVYLLWYIIQQSNGSPSTK